MIIIIRGPAVAVCSQSGCWNPGRACGPTRIQQTRPKRSDGYKCSPAAVAADPGCPPPPKLQLTLVINLLQLPQIIEQLLGYIVVKIGICLLFPTMSLSNCMLGDSEWCFWVLSCIWVRPLNPAQAEHRSLVNKGSTPTLAEVSNDSLFTMNCQLPTSLKIHLGREMKPRGWTIKEGEEGRDRLRTKERDRGRETACIIKLVHECVFPVNRPRTQACGETEAFWPMHVEQEEYTLVWKSIFPVCDFWFFCMFVTLKCFR